MTSSPTVTLSTPIAVGYLLYQKRGSDNSLLHIYWQTSSYILLLFSQTNKKVCFDLEPPVVALALSLQTYSLHQKEYFWTCSPPDGASRAFIKQFSFRAFVLFLYDYRHIILIIFFGMIFTIMASSTLFSLHS